MAGRGYAPLLTPYQAGESGQGRPKAARPDP